MSILSAQRAAELKSALRLDLAQFVLDMAGIVDPTGIADLTSAGISLWRGDWLGAGISFLGVFAGLGDLAKLGKLGKYSKTVEKAIELARVDKEFAKLVYPYLKDLKGVFNRLPIDRLPADLKPFVQRIKYQIDAFVKEVPPVKQASRQATKEVVVACHDMQAARNQAIQFLEKNGVQFGPHYRPCFGRLGAGKDKVVGVESTQGTHWRIRIDFDPNKGPHYNAEFGKGAAQESRAFTFPPPPGTHPEKWIEAVIQRLGDPTKRPRPPH
jgi:hypothetical protein